ncbi:MAG: hypothetical protein RR521_04390 [Clostridia bacterium]
MKRMVCGMLVTLLLLVCTLSAHADKRVELFDDAFYAQFELRKDTFVSAYDFTHINDTIYVALSNAHVYAWDAAKGSYRKVSELPKLPAYNAELPFKELSDALKVQLQASVFTLIPGDGELLGLNHLFGKIGKIASNGIAWRSTQLDTSILTRKGQSYPASLLYPFIYRATLYGFYDMQWAENGENPCEGILLAFDLNTGAYEQAALNGAFTFCRYGDDSLLLMRDNGSATPVLSTYSLRTKTMEDLPLALPIKLDRVCFGDFYRLLSEIGGLAYNPANRQIAFVCRCKLWSSIDGQPFTQALDLSDVISYTLPNAQGWFMPDGRYCLQTNGLVYVLPALQEVQCP